MFVKLQNWLTKKLRTRYYFDRGTITAATPFSRKFSFNVRDIQEIGIKTTDDGPMVEDTFWLLNPDTDNVHIPSECVAFKQLMDYFGQLEGFDWQPFIEAMSCTERSYFLCWKRPGVLALAA
jgi:hypothetical protein